MAALAVVSGIGALNGWTLVTTEVARAAANDGLFPRAFAWADRKDTAWFGIVMAALLPSLLMLWAYTTKTGLTIFGPNLVQPLRKLFEDLDGPALAEFLVGGVLKADLHPARAHSLKWDMLQADDFVLPPLRNVATNTNAAQARHRGGHHRRQRAVPRPRRPALHDLPDRAGPGLRRSLP